MLQFSLAAPGTLAALDPFGWIIAAIIIFNLLSPLFVRRKKRMPQSSATPPPQRPSSALTPMTSKLGQRVQTITRDVTQISDADKEKLRQALAAAGIQTLASEVQRRLATAAPSTAAAQTVQATFATPASLANAALLPPPELPPLPNTEGLTLMTLESGATAFNKLLPGAPTSGTAPAAVAFGVVRSPRGVANAFVAAAIVGPCAALRPLGHTPAGW